ncbi:unnamed protein product [Adineta steineri]|uniref:Chlorophyllase n=1 Tax=Adineta steineri TaxID=433720 RepID=A0A815JR68_9BILA|nr:unnamed protein product [Adineta steineri]CAF1383208.1 unnamed protein product [Adineta steineri]
MFFALSILFLTTICFSSAGKIDHWSVGNIIITDPAIRFRLDIYSPTTPGSYPVLIYLPGLAGLVPTTFYTTMIIKPNDGATRLFTEHKAVKDVLPNMNRLGFLSHSSAAHSLGQYLNTTCGPLKLIIMMNPVDGIDPFGIVQDFITHPPTPLPFRTPTLIISAGLDNVSIGKKTPACAPNNISNDRWYRSLYGPTFFINITDYGHADNLDEPFHEASKLMCTPCKGSICHFSQYKTDEATLITSFVHAIFGRDLQQLQIIKNPQIYLQSHVLNKYNLHGYNYTFGGPGGFCTHD